MLRTVFFGTPEFSLPSLEATFKNSELLAVVSQPDRPRGRGQKLSPCETRAWAQSKGIATFAPASLRKDSPEKNKLLEFLASSRVDLFMVTAYGLILPENVLSIPRLGAFNVHASLLPRWRGAAPIQRALEAGDRESGVCLQKMVLEMDAGDIVLEKKLPILEQHNAETLSQDLSALSFTLVEDFFLKGGPSSFKLRPQDFAGITLAAKISKEEAKWRPSWSATETSLRSRAFFHWPKVFFQLADGPEVKILAAAPCLETVPGEPGEIRIQSHGSRVLLFSDSPLEAVELQIIQVPGKAPCNAYDYFQNLASRTKLRAL